MQSTAMEIEKEYTGPPRPSWKTPAQDNPILLPFEREWLLMYGVDENSIDAVHDTVPVSTLRYLYLDVLEWGPEVTTVRKWVTRVVHHIQFKNVRVLWALTIWGKDKEFLEFLDEYEKLTQVNDQSDELMARSRLRIFHGATALDIASKALDLLPGGSSYAAQGDVEQTLDTISFHILMMLSGETIFPPDSRVNELRAILAPKVWNSVMEIPMP